MAEFTYIGRYFKPTVDVAIDGVKVAAFEDGEGLNIGFSVQRTLTPSPDSVVVRVHNLDPDNAKKYSSQLSKVGVGELELRAGYERTLVGLFKGDLRKSITRKEGRDLVTTFEADNAGDAVADVSINAAVANVPLRRLIEMAALALGLKIGPSVDSILRFAAPEDLSPFDVVHAGPAREFLDEAARRVKARWFVQDGAIQMVWQNRALSTRPAIVAQPEYLLQELTELGDGRISIVLFFDPNHVPGGQVKVGSTNFRIDLVEHSGEAYGTSPWASSIEGTAL